MEATEARSSRMRRAVAETQRRTMSDADAPNPS